MFSTQRRVEFRDTDAAGIVHFSSFFPMMESAEHELLRSLGLSVMPKTLAAPGHQSSPDSASQSSESNSDQVSQCDVDLNVTWPRVSANCDYFAASRFEDLLQIDVAVIRMGTSSITYRFDFTREETAIAQGKITVVCCKLSAQGLSKVPIPAVIREKLAAFLEPDEASS